METSASPPPPTTSPTKPRLRIMCSYGGHIVPNPRSKSLCYIGGDTRILSIDPTTASTLSSLTSHLAATLSLPAPLFLKYQLPRHDLLSLLSLSTDDDLLIFLDELRRLSNSASRIRLFVFFAKTHHQCKAIQHPKTESWFIDALESAKIVMQKGMRSNGLVGFEAESQSQSECLSGGGSRQFLSCGVGGGGSVAAESIVLETSSSFGSTSSSASLSNLPSVRARDEDVMAGTLLDNKVKVATGESIAREHSVGAGNGISLSQTDAVINVASMENRVSYNYAESDIKLSDPNFSGIQVRKTVQGSGYYPVTPQLDQLQQPKLQFVQVGTHYIPQNPVGMLPVSSYYPMYHPQLHQQQQQHLHYQPNQPYPIYILPAAPAQPYNLPMHGSSFPIAHGHPPLYPNASCIPPQATQNEPIKAGVSSDFASRVYRPVHSEMPHHGGVPPIHVPYDGNQQQPSGVSEMQHETIAIVSRESPKYSNQPDNDPARDLIYKSQPSAPSLAYQSMTKDSIHLSEALTQFHIDNRKQQTGNSDSQ
ncbi:hypothetical protein CerSpe_116660 [Prunus speciosa]